MKKITSILIACFLFVLANNATAQVLNSVYHTPNPASTNNNVTLQMAGLMPDACWYVNNCTWYWSGNTVFIAVDFNYGQPNPTCTQQIGPWNRNINLGNLLAGNYTAAIYNENYGHSLGSYDFTVYSNCQAPTAAQIFATAVTCTSATLNCSVPNIQGLKARYKPVSSSNWLTYSISSGNSININNLVPNTQYEFQINICNTESWSPSKNFTTCQGGQGTGVCSNPYIVACGNTYNGNNANGANNNNSYSGSGVSFTQMYGPEVFYQITLNQSGPLNLSLTGLAYGKDLDLIVLSSCNSNSIVAYSGNANNSSEYINTNLPAGTYRIVVDGWNYAVSSYTLSVQCTSGCTAPSANQLFASLVNTNSARINCTLGATSYDWRYRIVGTGAWTDLNHNSLNYADLSFLNPYTNYEFQCSVYCNGTWTSWSSSQYFITGYTLALDEPCNAVELFVQYECIPVSGSNTTATTTWIPAPPAGCGTSSMRDVWYKLQIPYTGVVNISTSAGSLTDAVISYYYGSSCNNLTPLINCYDDDQDGNRMPHIKITGTPGTWYYIRVWGFNGQYGTFSICAHTSNGLVEDSGDRSEQSNIVVNKDKDSVQETIEPSIRIFPVPAQDEINVSATLATEGDVIIRILNMAGQVVKEETRAQSPAGELETTLDISSLPSGTYLLRFHADGRDITSKFVKM